MLDPVVCFAIEQRCNVLQMQWNVMSFKGIWTIVLREQLTDVLQAAANSSNHATARAQSSLWESSGSAITGDPKRNGSPQRDLQRQLACVSPAQAQEEESQGQTTSLIMGGRGTIKGDAPSQKILNLFSLGSCGCFST